MRDRAPGCFWLPSVAIAAVVVVSADGADSG